MASLTPRLDKLESGRNLVINGNMDHWQRNTSFNISGANYNFRTADRWTLGKDTTPSTVVASRSTDVPTFANSNFQSVYSLLVTNNAVGNTPASNDGLFINHRIEGQDYQEIHGKKVRIQFYVKSSVTGTYSFLAINKTTGSNMRYYATTYVVSVANTWEKKTIDITLDNTGVWNFDNSIGLCLHWTLSCGAGTQTPTLNAWTTSVAQFEGSQGQVNWTGTNSSTFQLAQVSLVPGDFGSDVDVPFARAGRTIQQELAMCQRYYQTVTAEGNTSAAIAQMFATSATQAICRFQHFVPMRTAPSFSTSAAASDYRLDGSNLVTASAVPVLNNNTSNSSTLTIQTAGSLVANAGYLLVANTGSSARLNFEAEL